MKLASPRLRAPSVQHGHIGGFPRRAGDDEGAIHAEPIAEVTVDAHGPIVIAEMPWLIGADQSAGRCGKVLAVRRRRTMARILAKSSHNGC